MNAINNISCRQYKEINKLEKKRTDDRYKINECLNHFLDSQQDIINQKRKNLVLNQDLDKNDYLCTNYQ